MGWLFLTLFLAAGCGNDQAIELPKRSIQVVDGDTLKAIVKNRQETIRLRLVDTPELNHKENGKQPLSEEAKAFTQKRIRDAEKVTLEPDEEMGRDPYGRMLAYIHVDGKLLQEELVENGYARIAFADQSNSKYLEGLKQAEKKARSQKAGVWQWQGYVRNDGFQPEALKNERNLFVASKNSDVYHPIGCHVAQEIKPENRIYYTSEAEAMKDHRRRSQVESCWANDR